MNKYMIVSVLSKVFLMIGLALFFPFMVGVLYQEPEANTFLNIILFTLFLSLLMSRVKHDGRKMSPKEGFLIVGLSWVCLTFIGALPFFFTGAIPNFADCIFESASGFTTTGSSILNEIDSLPKSILFWRSATHFIGGLGILVFMVALIPLTDQRQIHMMKAEMPGPSVGKLAPKLRNSMIISVITYLVLSAIQLSLLLFVCQMPFFDAITTVFSTAGTGGFSIHNESLAYYNSVEIDVICSVFMMLFGINFNFYFFLSLRQWKQAFSEEIRWYFMIILGACGLILWNSWSMFANVWEGLHYVFFTVTSTISTTGFVTVDYEMWPAFSRNVILLIMLCGSCGGSTGGGMKVSRLIILFKQVKCEILRMLHPRSVHVIAMDHKAVDSDVVSNTFSFFAVYMLLIFFGTLVVSLDGIDFESAITSVITCINNVGPGYGMVGPVHNFSGYSNFVKYILSLLMLLGRLEIFPMLLLFSPMMYRYTK